MEGKKKKEEEKKMKWKIRNYRDFVVFFWVVAIILIIAAFIGIYLLGD